MSTKKKGNKKKGGGNKSQQQQQHKPSSSSSHHTHDDNCDHSHDHDDHHGHQHHHGHDCDHQHHQHQHHHHSHDNAHQHSHDSAHQHHHQEGDDHHHEHSHGHHHDHHHDHHDHDHDHNHDHAYPHAHEYVDPITELSQRLAMTHVSVAQRVDEANHKVGAKAANGEDVVYHPYAGEHQLADLMALIDKDLSEPYSIYTYRYFINNWPQLCILASVSNEIIGVIVCKLDLRHRGGTDRSRGYIAMLAVAHQHRKLGIGSRLVREALHKMILERADEVALETEVTNKGALALYENLGFLRDKSLHKYYLNGGDAFRLILVLTPQFLIPAANS